VRYILKSSFHPRVRLELRRALGSGLSLRLGLLTF
jgi:hypothetical protein